MSKDKYQSKNSVRYYNLTPDKVVDLNSLLSYYNGSSKSMSSMKYIIKSVRIFKDTLVFEDGKGIVRSVRPKPTEDYRLKEMNMILEEVVTPDDVVPLSDSELAILKPLLQKDYYKDIN